MKPMSVLTIFACLLVTANFTFADIWPHIQKLLALDGTASDNFGYSVAIDGDYAIIGAYLDSDMKINSGSAYIFKYDGTAWIQQAKLTAADGAASDYFGVSVSISGDYAIVGRIAKTSISVRHIFSTGTEQAGLSRQNCWPPTLRSVIISAGLSPSTAITLLLERMEIMIRETIPARRISSSATGQRGLSKSN